MIIHQDGSYEKINSSWTLRIISFKRNMFFVSIWTNPLWNALQPSIVYLSVDISAVKARFMLTKRTFEKICMQLPKTVMQQGLNLISKCWEVYSSGRCKNYFKDLSGVPFLHFFTSFLPLYQVRNLLDIEFLIFVQDFFSVLLSYLTGNQLCECFGTA